MSPILDEVSEYWARCPISQSENVKSFLRHSRMSDACYKRMPNETLGKNKLTVKK